MENILITGANKGIGLELVKKHMKRGDKVYALCRTPSDELTQSGAQVISNINFLKDDFELLLSKQIENVRLDRVIANAGIWKVDTFESFRMESIRQHFEVNTLAPLRLIKCLEKQLKTGSKIILISTRVASLMDNSSGNEFGYRMSKTALNMAGVNLAHALKAREITVFMLHPGFVKTDLTKGDGLIDASVSAENIVNLSDELRLKNSGSFWHAIEKKQLPW